MCTFHGLLVGLMGIINAASSPLRANVFYNPPALAEATFVPVAVPERRNFLPQSSEESTNLANVILFLTGFYGVL